jgi:hypothetical protein
MRDHHKLLYLAVGSAGWVLLCILFPEPHTELPSIFVMGALVLFMIFPTFWSIELMRKKSPQLGAFGFQTSLLQLEPIDSCRTIDPITGKEWEWGLFLNGGIKLFGTKGGGPAGCCVVRMDLVSTLGGDQSHVWINSVGMPHQEDARPGDPYHDITELPQNILKMVRRWNYDPRGHVMWFRDPIEEPGKFLKDRDQLPYKNLWTQANEQINKQNEQIKNLNTRLTQMSETESKIKEGYGRRRKIYDYGREDRYDRDPRGDDVR